MNNKIITYWDFVFDEHYGYYDEAYRFFKKSFKDDESLDRFCFSIADEKLYKRAIDFLPNLKKQNFWRKGLE